MKNFLYIFSLLSLLASCASSRSGSMVRHKPAPAAEEPKFLDNIAIKPSSQTVNTEADVNVHRTVKPKRDMSGSLFSTDIENCHDLQFKYAIMMDEKVETVTNHRLVSFLEEWYGTPYKYGGNSRDGVDCSAFTCRMLENVFGVSIPRTCREQYSAGKKITKDKLQHGDLVFFNTRGGISHVGVYLGNNKFVHASVSSGVMVSDLDDVYFKRRYVGAARLR